MSVSGARLPTPRAAPRRVLEDVSGRRLQRMRWVGRATALLFLGWLVVVILGGIGVGPAGRFPLGHLLRPTAGPPPVRHIPPPAAPAASDLAPALPAPAGASTAVSAAQRVAARGRAATAPGQTTTRPHGRSGSAPGASMRTTTGATTTTVTTKPGKGLGRGQKP